jgi:biotin operon repressor
MSDATRVLRLLTNASATQRDIAAACDIPIRTVQEIIQELRLEGQPIISVGWRGMRLSRNADEALACAVSLRRRAITQLLTARALRRTARAMQLAENKPPEVEAPEGSLWRIAS